LRSKPSSRRTATWITLAVAPKISAPLFIHRFEFSIVESSFNRELLTFGSRAPEGFLVFQSPEEVKVHTVFEWGDELFGVKAIRVNGHSPGMTGFLDGENGLIYAGDSFFGERIIQAVGLPYLVDPELFKASIKELQDYAEKGYSLIPSHGKPVEGEEAVELLEFNLKRAEETESLVLELLKKTHLNGRACPQDNGALRCRNNAPEAGTQPRPGEGIHSGALQPGEIEAKVDGGLKWRAKTC